MKSFILLALVIAVCSASVLQSQPKTRAEGSCAGRCGDNTAGLSCQCNSDCDNFSDCCTDYSTVCYTCQDRCGESYNYASPCVCSDGCEDFGDCCDDYTDICSGSVTGSCSGRCGDYDATQTCQCNTECSSFGNCCTDYDSVCSSSSTSCVDRCGESYNSDAPCVCSDGCESFGDCCDDYSDICSGSSTGVTDQDILDFTEQIFTIGQADFVGKYIVFDSNPPGPLFISIDDAAFASDTMQTFLTLRGFYDPDSCTAEDLSTDYETAKTAFLDAIMATEVMGATSEFLLQTGLLTGTLRDFVDLVFLSMYTRCSPIEGSSGFEHSFMGEVDDNEVKGFHNWISFYLEELVGRIDYTDFIDQQNISPELDLFMMGFDWLGYTKPISSMWIGSTPEMELALYSVSFLYKSNSLVQVSMNDALYRIQTYTQLYNGEELSGSAYPDIS